MSSRMIKNNIGGNHVIATPGNNFERCDFFRAGLNLPPKILPKANRSYYIKTRVRKL